MVSFWLPNYQNRELTDSDEGSDDDLTGGEDIDIDLGENSDEGKD